MKKFKNISLAAVLILCYAGCFANGDPVDQISALTRSANPVARPIPDIYVINEKLSVQVGTLTTVKVQYLLWNKSDKDYTDIDYGFPIDYAGGGKDLENSALYGDLITESRSTAGWQDRYIRGISFFANGNLLPFQASDEETVIEPAAAFADLKKQMEGDEWWLEGDGDGADGMAEYEEHNLKYGGTFRRWFYTRFSVPAGKTVLLEVNYTILPLQSYFQADASTTSGSFYYDMSPAANWGDGKARELHVDVDFSQLKEPPHPFGVEGLPFTRKGDKFTYQARDFNFKDSKPLEFQYFGTLSFEPYSESDLILLQRIPNDAYTLTATNTDGKYPASNLTDMDLNTAWVGKDNGSNSVIRFDFKGEQSVKGMKFVPGYVKNQKTYTENSRPREIKIKIVGSWAWNKEALNDFEYSVKLEDKPFQEIYLEDLLWKNMDVQAYLPDYVDHIEISFPKVWPGAKYNDLCVSQILLFDADPLGVR